ncbi:MAG: hypothetical protein LBM87_05155 [Ruminococcus sp.]|jgi:hypothetical protein|nr:hypothetical protein [Ruminococcus sp.]
MFSFKKFFSGAVALVLTLSITACGEDTIYAASYGDTEIPAGVYINMQSSAVTEATDKMSEEDVAAGVDLLDATIDGLPAETWIDNRAVELMKEYAAVEEKFAELGLTYTNNADGVALGMLEQMWAYYADALTEMGISKDSYQKVLLNTVKREEIFRYYYGEGGEKAIPEADIKAHLLEENALINYIPIELKDGAGNFLKDDADKKARMDMALEYVSRAEDGVDFDALLKEYNDYQADLVAAATPAAETTTEEETPAENPEDELLPSNETVITREGATPSTTVAEKVFEKQDASPMTDGAEEIFVVEDAGGEMYYVVKLMDLFSQDGYYDDNMFNVMDELKGEEFDETVKLWAADLKDFTVNEKAVKRYKVKNLM